MKIARRDEILALKESRRAEIEKLEYDDNGNCIHVGPISRGCRTCFIRRPGTFQDVYTGCECNANCGYCYYEKDRTDESWRTIEQINEKLGMLYQHSVNPSSDLLDISYNSTGETLMYMPIIEEAARIVRRIEAINKRRIYNHLYTNGILATHDVLERLKRCGVIELRFHPSASNFSKNVLDNMRDAVKMGFIVTVEEPSLPENKNKLLEHLEVFQEIGIKHLDIVECQVTRDNINYLDRKYPNGVMYQDKLWQLYDGGMVYDIIGEVIKNKYEFSVLDCNSRVEGCRASEHHYIHEFVNWTSMDDVINKDVEL